jgi:nucleoside-diphosphate-sugar epimerase
VTSNFTVVGATGRIAKAICPHLEHSGWAMRPVGRARLDLARVSAASQRDLADEIRGSVILNLAGQAHLRSRPVDVHALADSNVALPLFLLDLALAARCDLVHLSSTKADPGNASLYAASKRTAEVVLRSRLARSSDPVGVALVRTCAVLAPPFDAGKLSLVRRVPKSLFPILPARSVPVTSPDRLASLILTTVSELEQGQVIVRTVQPSDHHSLREVADVVKTR